MMALHRFTQAVRNQCLERWVESTTPTQSRGLEQGQPLMCGWTVDPSLSLILRQSTVSLDLLRQPLPETQKLNREMEKGISLPSTVPSA